MALNFNTEDTEAQIDNNLHGGSPMKVTEAKSSNQDDVKTAEEENSEIVNWWVERKRKSGRVYSDDEEEIIAVVKHKVSDSAVMHEPINADATNLILLENDLIVKEEIIPAAPRIVYHVVQLSEWDAAMNAGTVYYPPTYTQDGFIHATHDAQLLVGVLNCFYKEIKDDFLCLAIDTKLLTSEVKMEAPAPVGNKTSKITADATVKEYFPHIFGPIAPISCIVGKYKVIRSEDGTFLKVDVPKI